MTPKGAPIFTDQLLSDSLPESAFRQMVEAAPLAVYMTDAGGWLTFFNDAAARLSGRSPRLGTDQWCVTWKLFLPDGAPVPQSECPLAVLLRGGRHRAGAEYMAERPDGTRFWFIPAPAVIRDAEGRITGGINFLSDITERKAAELEATAHFRAIVETTPDCVQVLDRDGKVLLMNSACLAIMGASSADEAVGRSVYDLIAAEERERFRKFNESVCAGTKGSMEFDILTENGARRHMAMHAAPLRYSDGTTVHLSIARDVTARIRAERAARHLSAIVESSHDAIISKDLNGVIQTWNKSAERVFGYTEAEAVGKPVIMLIPVDRRDEEPKILERLRRGECVDHFETVRQRKDGSLLEISLTISPVKDAAGNVVGASKIARDITEQKRAERALLASEARFRQLADSMPQIVWTATPDGRPDYANERWYEFSGFSREAPVSWESILHPEDLNRFREAWRDSVASARPLNIEFRLRDNGENCWRWFVGRALAVRNADGSIAKWFGSCTDINEQKRVEDDLRRANLALEEFAFSASHDLQEPLRSVKIYSEMLSTACGDLDPQARQFLHFVRDGATRMETLIRDLLTYTQVTNFEMPAEPADAEIAFAGALANLSGRIAETGARVTADPLPRVMVHGMHLQQLFQNLIGNAIKYRSPDRSPEVHVSVARLHGAWRFAVNDNGIGIDPQYKETIFGLFKRLHSREEYSGTGIGLAICRRIVDRYHGRIWVESELGRGSSFCFTAPV